MTALRALYRDSLALLTDLYELTMAYGYWKAGVAEREAVFHLSFRRNPFDGGYALAAGLQSLVEFLDGFRFGEDDLAYLAQVPAADGSPLFESAFLEHLGAARLSCTVHAVPEGTVVFPQEPLVRVIGPVWQAQLLETALLNLINFPTLIATKASRLVHATGGEPVLEFGLRRAQGIDGGVTASRAAYIGGCAATSNVLAGKLFGIPVKGTHAHSWVMLFDSEVDAFAAYADAMPSDCVFLVDTYDSVEGVRHAIEVGHRLRERGHDLRGVRLDSGDLAALSIEARRMLDEAGFAQTAIVASNDLDESIVESLEQQGAAIGVWGVGTKLATGGDQPALGGVYKLGAVRDESGAWSYRLKLSEQIAKVSIPGVLQVRRFLDGTRMVADMVYNEGEPLDAAAAWTLIDPLDMTRRLPMKPNAENVDLLVPVFVAGERVYDPPPLEAVRERAARQVAALPDGVKRFVNPHRYDVGLEASLFELKTRLVLEARGARP